MAGKGKGEGAKERGNEAFRKGQYAEAVGFYTEAILADATNHVFYLNRSMAYMKLNKYEDTERDASTSLRLEGGNVKAFFRRGSARKQLSKWEEARQDFEKVLELDSTNAEAKAEIGTLQGKLAAVKAASIKPPLDVSKLPSQRNPEEEEKARSSNSVEAARSFLEKVGMSDEAPTVNNKIPDRFPGETGSFLKEVSTRRLDKRSIASTKEKSVVPPEKVTIDAKSSSVVPSTQEKNRGTLLTSAASNGIPSNNDGTTSKVRLSAYELYRRLRQSSASTDLNCKHSTQLELLASLDIASIPSMLGSLLEPELLADILEALLQADKTQNNLLVDIMSVLPRCERFETSLMFLEHDEKQRAIEILEKIRKAESSEAYDKLITLWKI